MATSSPELRSQRITALTSWLADNNQILITPVAGLKRILPPIDYWDQFQLTFEVGHDIHIDSYLNLLVKMGYERVDMVSNPAEFSIRGGIIDLYPITETHPVRVELFDEEVDSIRYFDAATQRSLKKITKIKIKPTTELLLTDEDINRTADRLEEGLADSLANLQDSKTKHELHQNISGEIELLRTGELIENIYKYNRYFYDQPASLLDYLGEDGYIMLDEIGRIQESAEHLDQEEAELIESLLEGQKLVRDLNLSYDWHTIWANMTQQKIYLSVFLRHVANTSPKNIVNVSSRPMQEFHGQMNLLQGEMIRWDKADYSVVFLVGSSKRAEKVQSIFRDYHLQVGLGDHSTTLPVKQPVIMVSELATGFELPLHKIAVITDQELFKTKTKKRQKKSQKLSNAERMKSYTELKEGDYVVHVNHGVGRFAKIETLEVQGVQKDFMLILYRGEDRLFVPIDQIDLVQKFVGSEGKKPKLHKLGGTEWTKVKSRVQSSVEDIADDLIKLYDERQGQKGYVFDKDTELHQEFEAQFPYQETADQLRSIEEIKQDMQKPRPMDRLLCGDVGYGKTEVAIRAAFKAVMDGKQVAFLVPTTILAQQHFETIIERFQSYPVEVRLLSRFRTRKEQQETIKDVKRGIVDIVIGTHRLLSKDVVYKDLGLLVVDEEQRFGVKHKEKIKQIKTNVDVLTLTATPIPRTLHMSMLGIRDLSVIETPPENRFPVQTYVLEHNMAFIKEAIERELARGGQVFLLYNRVNQIDKVAQEISSLVETARVSTAHGRMNETELENVMLEFLEGESDILVSTSIIETGVDIPNVNTLIVYDADHMGLSQLYQLRGRVGRSNRVAYAYFTYRRDKILTEVSEKRLQAIKEFTELGSGFNIAMRDLSIRGAGNLLGSQQHGFIDSVGFDMYSQMLKDAIDARKAGMELEDIQPFEPKLNLNIDAYIPDDYISDEKQKIDMYKQFQIIRTTEELDDLKDELMDRFGNFPDEVDHLLTVTMIKMFATRERVESINEMKQKIEIIIDENRSQQIDGAKLFEVAHAYGRMIQLGTEQNKLKIVVKWNREQKDRRYETVGELLDKLAQVDRNG